MSTSMQTEKIKQSWDIKEMQEAATKMVSHKIASRINFLEKHPGKEIEEMEKASAHLNAEKMKKCGVKTPLDLAKHLAEYEVNMFGAEASVSGDDDHAVLTNEKSPVWLETKKSNNLSKDQQTTMQTHYSNWMEDLAQGLGFKAHVDIAKDGNTSQITFSRK